MRLAALSILLLALASCKRSSSPSTPADAGHHPGAAPAPPPASASASSARSNVGPAEPVPGEYGRYYVDGKRFSVVFPVSPEAKWIAPANAVEATDADGSFYAAICSPPGPPGAFGRARQRVAAGGTFLGDSHPSFYGTEAYEVRAKRPDGSERVERFIQYGGRFCSVAVTLANGVQEQNAARFIESFRPENVK